ncbi:phage tail tube protein [Marinobacter pelagius]|uniref:Major tail protein n=1 Tax=Marinobacter pelagius TaxID=379482 RepID=A0A1I4T3Y9_9GAMM|nr:hypothetical protein [Marinobacter pelagius]SFM71333.1 hypothetical protein SAMN04487961_0984 [Marinobacter pelagius]
MAYREESYIGNGKIWERTRGSTDPFREVGNCSALTLGVTTEEASLPNYRGGGGEANKRERITAVALTVTAHDFNAENIAAGLRGDVSANVASSVASEVQPGADSGLVRTNFLIDTSQPVTVTGPSGTPSYIQGTDFNISAAGIEVIDGGSIASGADIEISYESLGTDIVDALMNSGVEKEIVFDGLNEAQSGSPVVVDIWRAKPGAAEELGLISDEYGALTLPYAVLLDTAKEAAGESGYFRVHKKVLA